MQIEITKQSEKDFRFLLSRLSHEIRNPVTLINSELQLMASSHPELAVTDNGTVLWITLNM